MNSLSIIQWNCRGVSQKLDLLLVTLFQNVDIIVLQETFLKPDKSLVIPGKILFRFDREGRPGGGLLIAVRNSLSVSRLQIDSRSIHSEIMGVSIGWSSSQLNLVNVYSHNVDVVPALSLALQNLAGSTLVLGDFNLHHPLWGGSFSSRFSDSLVSWLCDEDFCLVNSTQTTHIAPSGTQALLDLSICSAAIFDRLSLSVNDDTFGSDHFPIHISVASSACPGPPRIFHRWSSIIREVNAILLPVSTMAYDEFIQSVKQVMAKHSFTRKATPIGFPAWWTARCANFYHQKKFLLKRAIRTVSTEAWLRYRHLSAKFRRAIKEAKRAFWDKVCRDASNPSFLFKIFKVLRQRTQPALDSNLCLKLNGVPVFDARRQADMFADAFRNTVLHEPLPVTYGPAAENDLNLPFSLPELTSAIHQMKISSPGEDGISVKLFKGLSSHSLQVFLEVLNSLWMSGSVPGDWSSAVLVPILKPGRPASESSSYRPIALTSVLGKICEKIIAQRLSTFLLVNQLFHPRHLGFVHFRDSQAAITLLHQDLLKARKERKFILGISLDLQSAYDAVYIDGLILKCAQLGITGNILRWLHNFLSNRRFRIRWRAFLSGYRNSTRGVPQGAVLSPILFMIFLADLFELLSSWIRCIVYADDIFLYCIHDSLQQCRQYLQEALRCIQQWCQRWKMSISPAKSHAINLSRKAEECDFQFWIGNGPISWSPVVKFLGFHFARRGGLRPHIDYLRRKAFQRINILKAIAARRYGARSAHLVQILSATIRSLADYGAPLLASGSPSLFYKLEVLHTSALRVGLGLPQWVSNLVLRRHASSPPLSLRLKDLSFRFWSKHLSLGQWSPLADVIVSYISSPVSAGSGSFTDFLGALDDLECHPDQVMRFCYPQLPVSGSIDFYLSGLPFQCAPRSTPMITALFLEFVYSLDGQFDIIGTDASKTASQTAIAGCSQAGTFGYRIPPTNSIFSAEAVAIATAVDELTSPPRPFVIFSDSLSVLTALHAASFKSPTVILWVLSKLQRSISFTSRIILCWVPSHCGIPLNERADALAGTVGQHDALLDWTSPEDLVTAYRNTLSRSFDQSFRTSKYWGSLGDIPRVKETSLWASSRREDVLLSRTICNMHITPEILHRFHLAPSSLCTSCGVPDSLAHIILNCRKYARQRASHFGAAVSSLYFCSFPDLIQQLVKTPDFRLNFLRFMKSIDRF